MATGWRGMSLLYGTRHLWCARTPQVNKALGFARWRDQGLARSVEQYKAIRFTT
jgi:hypothetical protein